MADQSMLIGEALVGEGNEIAHIDLLIGPKSGPVGAAFAAGDEVPADGRQHELTIYMEDTMWPYADKFCEYIDRCGEVYAKSLDRPAAMLTIQAAFQPVLGSHLRGEVA